MGAVMRLNDWNQNLNNVIDVYRERAFCWGRADCLNLVNDAHHAMTGEPLAADWLGDYETPLQAARWYRKLCREQSATDIIEALDRRLERFKGVLPPIGSIVARQSDANIVTGYALGVCTGEKFVFVGDNGLKFTPVERGDIFWLVQ